jgi:hypothetical protein
MLTPRLVVGTMKRGVSIKSSYEGRVTIRIGELQWPKDADREFVMTSSQANLLGLRILEQAARAKVDRERYLVDKRHAALRAKRRAEQVALAAS